MLRTAEIGFAFILFCVVLAGLVVGIAGLLGWNFVHGIRRRERKIDEADKQLEEWTKR